MNPFLLFNKLIKKTSFLTKGKGITGISFINHILSLHKTILCLHKNKNKTIASITRVIQLITVRKNNNHKYS